MKGLRLGLGQSKLQDKWTAEAKMRSAKTVCTAGGGLWQAKHPPLLVLGNVTLAPPRPGLERLLVHPAWYPSFCSCVYPACGCG